MNDRLIICYDSSPPDAPTLMVARANRCDMTILNKIQGDEAFGIYYYLIGQAELKSQKEIPKKPIFWRHQYFDSRFEDDWGYECPCCGNRDIDYPEHHCICGQALDWSEMI